MKNLDVVPEITPLSSGDKSIDRIQQKIERFQTYSTVRSSLFEEIEEDIKSAKNAGKDVTKLEAKISGLKQKALVNRLKEDIEYHQKLPDILLCSIKNIRDYIDIKSAKNAGVDVAEFEAQILELEQRIKELKFNN